MMLRVLWGVAALAVPAWASASAVDGELRFPEGFKWCVSTAAHQIEGGNTESDWWDWERTPGKIARGETSELACNHWDLFPVDTLLMRRLNVDTYRFSIEWAKIEPRDGEFSAEATLHYIAEIALLRAAGIEPMVTLQHFTLPRWVREKGGWEWAGSAQAFARYAGYVYENIGSTVRDWGTINEPMVHILGGYLSGQTPPGVTDIHRAADATVGLLKAHRDAYRELHRLAARDGREIRVGVAQHLRVFEGRNDFLDRYVAKVFDRVFNWSFLDAIKTGKFRAFIPFALDYRAKIEGLAGTQDYLGINYYTRDIVNVNLRSRPLPVDLLVKEGAPTNDMGWEIYPEGMHDVLTRAHARYPDLPIMITENGVADATDRLRPDYIRDHLAEVHRAIADGVPVEGYCHWSLMDNFEWVFGYAPRFGLYHVDYETQLRTPRPSARIFAEIAHGNALPAR